MSYEHETLNVSPVVMSIDAVKVVLENLKGDKWLMASRAPWTNCRGINGYVGQTDRLEKYMKQNSPSLTAQRVAGVGEPWVSFLDPGALIMDLKAIGFTQAEDIGPEEINARFFKARADKLMVGNFGHLMKAQL